MATTNNKQKKVISLKVLLPLEITNPAFMTFYFLHILKTAIKENTSVRAENELKFRNCISTYIDNKAVSSINDKKFGHVIFQTKHVETQFDMFWFTLHALSWMDEQQAELG